jgi:uncharacterized protein
MTTGPDPEAVRVARLFLARIADDFPILEAWLYGSRARGDSRHDSDVDVAIVLGGPKGKAVEIGPEMVAKGFDVILENDLLVSPLPVWLQDWRSPSGHANPWLISNIKRDGIHLV